MYQNHFNHIINKLGYEVIMFSHMCLNKKNALLSSAKKYSLLSSHLEDIFFKSCIVLQLKSINKISTGVWVWYKLYEGGPVKCQHSRRCCQTTAAFLDSPFIEQDYEIIMFSHKCLNKKNGLLFLHKMYKLPSSHLARTFLTSLGQINLDDNSHELQH